jgi:serpin B
MRKLLPALAALSSLAFGCNGSTPPTPLPEAPAASDAAAPTSAPAEPAGTVAEPSVPSTPATVPLDEVARSNQLAARLHKTITQKDRGNVFTSPTSLRLALGMVYVGAEGETAKQIASALSLSEPANATADAAKSERDAWASLASPAVELRVANRLWGDKATKLEPGFLSLTQRGWGAPLEPVDFQGAQEPSRKLINAWIAKETKDRIPELLPQGSLTPLTRLVVTNAVYFKGKWQTPFDKALTTPRDFASAAGAKKVPFMHQTGGFAYAEESDARLVSIPYGPKGEVSMVIVLPKAVDGLGAIEAKLSSASFDGWSKALAAGSERLELALPKVEMRWGGSVRPALEALGMKKAFTDDAELEGIQKNGDLKVTDVFHKTFVAIDEVGTEAAAATGVVIGTRSMPAPPTPFVVDRPFLFFLRDTSSGRVLFLGRIVDPAAK